MGLSELILIYAMNHAIWSMDQNGVPQICMTVPSEEGEFKGCTAVPDEILYKWLEETTVKV
jgi:hypothetical protein